MTSKGQASLRGSAQPPKKKQRVKGPAGTLIMDQFFRQVLSGKKVPETLIPPDADQLEENKKSSAGEKLARLFELGRVLNLQSSAGLGIPAGVTHADIIAELDKRLTDHLDAMYDQLHHFDVQTLDQRDGTLTIRSGLGSHVTKMEFVDMFLRTATNPTLSKQMLQERVKKYGEDNRIVPAPAPTKDSSHLARFNPGFDASAPVGSKAAQNVHQARCDVLTSECCQIYGTAASGDGSLIAIAGGAGWKDRAPALEIAKRRGPDDEPKTSTRDPDFKLEYETPGFWEPGHATCVDSERELVWIAGDNRVKAFAMEDEAVSCQYTLQTGGRVKGLTMVGDRLFASVGKEVKYWDVGSVEKHVKDVSGMRIEGILHDPKTTKEKEERIRAKYEVWFECHDLDENDAENTEATRGHDPHGSLSLGFSVERFLALPASVSGFEGAAAATKTDGYGVYVCDMERATIRTRLFGHTGGVEQMSASAALPNLLASASRDTTVKLWDLRTRGAVCTLQGLLGFVQWGVALVSEGGYPFCFTGGQNESVLAWDLRMLRNLYELSTGNTAVRSLYWNGTAHSLLAVTECDYFDRLGNAIGYEETYDYNGTDDELFDDEGEEGDEEEGYGRNGEKEEPYRWPKEAAHTAKDFAVTWDAGRHLFIQYSFKRHPGHCLPDAANQEWA